MRKITNPAKLNNETLKQLVIALLRIWLTVIGWLFLGFTGGGAASLHGVGQGREEAGAQTKRADQSDRRGRHD